MWQFPRKPFILPILSLQLTSTLFANPNLYTDDSSSGSLTQLINLFQSFLSEKLCFQFQQEILHKCFCVVITVVAANPFNLDPEDPESMEMEVRENSERANSCQ